MKYIFRGNVVFDYNEDNNNLIAIDDGIVTINHCKLIDEDFILMEQFFKNINDYKKDNTIELKDIVVD